MFKFGKVAGIPEELTPPIPGSQNMIPRRRLRVWWIAMNMIGGNSGSPIFFDPLFPPGGDISSGEARSMLIGLQSLSIPGADLAGMTPASFILDVIAHSVPDSADLSLGIPRPEKPIVPPTEPHQ
jgi:hypothetical protein